MAFRTYLGQPLEGSKSDPYSVTFRYVQNFKEILREELRKDFIGFIFVLFLMAWIIGEESAKSKPIYSCHIYIIYAGLMIYYGIRDSFSFSVVCLFLFGIPVCYRIRDTRNIKGSQFLYMILSYLDRVQYYKEYSHWNSYRNELNIGRFINYKSFSSPQCMIRSALPGMRD